MNRVEDAVKERKASKGLRYLRLDALDACCKRRDRPLRSRKIVLSPERNGRFDKNEIDSLLSSQYSQVGSF